MKISLHDRVTFEERHNGISAQEEQEMARVLGASSTDELIEEAIPQTIRKKEALRLPAALSEVEYIHKMRKIASKNDVFNSFIGQGYYHC